MKKMIHEKNIFSQNRKLIDFLEGKNPKKIFFENIRTIDEVIEMMDKIDQICTMPNDGLKAFHWLYRQVTLEIQKYCEQRKWKSPTWMIALDVEFAKLYFEGILASLKNDLDAPLTWKFFIDHRFKKKVSKAQFALAGINAHINRDLMIAIVRAFEITYGRENFDIPLYESSELEDFQAVDKILERVEMEALKELAAEGRIKKILDLTGNVTLATVLKTISFCRSKAWESARKLNTMSKNPKEQKTLINQRDRLAAKMTRILLIPIENDT